MADEEDILQDEEEQPKKSGKKKLIIILVLVLMIGGGAAVFLGGFGGGKKEETQEDANRKPQIIYLDLDEFLINLNNPGKQVNFLKLTITLELPNMASQNAINEHMPRVRDNFQVYLRELRNSDLKGSAGLQRLREELLLRVNQIIEPETVNDILFKDIMVQ